MKKFARFHIVDAEPMSFGSWCTSCSKLVPDGADPAKEGYRVIYPDGYVSWCPKDAFEAAGRPIDGMTFGMAIEAMKRGEKVARKGWNGKGMWLCIPLVEGPKEIPASGVWGKPNAEYAKKNGGTVKVMPYITMKAADGSIVMGWLASQTDMLSEDWEIV
jgi:hypothetical protein